MVNRTFLLHFSHIRQHVIPTCDFFIFYPVGKEIRDRFSGAVEAFSRRNISSASPHHSRHRTYEDLASPKDVVNFYIFNRNYLDICSFSSFFFSFRNPLSFWQSLFCVWKSSLMVIWTLIPFSHKILYFIALWIFTASFYRVLPRLELMPWLFYFSLDKSSFNLFL